jgi:hypothetical protein
LGRLWNSLMKDRSVLDMFWRMQHALYENSRFYIRMISMSKRLSRKEFLVLADLFWQGDAKVRYQNPDNWIIV